MTSPAPAGPPSRARPAPPAGRADDAFRAVTVVDIDLARPGEFRAPGGRPPRSDPTGPALALVRLHGRPLGTVTATAEGPRDLWRALADRARRELPGAARTPASVPAPAPPRAGEPRPQVGVVVATRDRTGLLRSCLDSLLAADPPPAEVIVVDNAPSDDSTERLVRTRYATRVRYLREPVPGLARAHNRGLAAVRTPLAAFTDDDTLVDPGWPAALAAAFRADPETGCVTGLIVPAELRTAAQAALERHGAFGKGFAPRIWSLRDPPADPLFPFTAGRFGSGTNMAFRTELLRDMGGFDPATGTGTPAHGGDDLLAFFRVLVGGRSLAYTPDAIVWHRHRRTPEALAAQAFGYGSGLGAYLAAAMAHEPRMLPALLRRVPGGLRHALARAGGQPGPDRGPSRRLALRELRGMAYGPVGYLRSRRRSRRAAPRQAPTAHRTPPAAAAPGADDPRLRRGPRRRGTG
ncbi:glycosyltransferase family 2 protein [Streptomyces sp. NPDC090026]|uniref:glycosyltransferase family 2 protein n=1 Tax=Streptomyces sp. NPDC090026 TaxID=3365923 RepID=UPI00380FBE9A